MKISAQDRNTAIIIAIVLVVCTISLVAIGSFVWRMVQPGVAELGNVLGSFAFRTTANYNFDVPTFEDVGVDADTVVIIEEESTNPDSGLNYNFELPPKRKAN